MKGSRQTLLSALIRTKVVIFCYLGVGEEQKICQGTGFNVQFEFTLLVVSINRTRKSQPKKPRLSVPDGQNGLTGQTALRVWLNLTLERGSSVGDYRGVWKLHVLSGISGTTHSEFLLRKQFDKYLGGTSLDVKMTIFTGKSPRQLKRTSWDYVSVNFYLHGVKKLNLT